MAQNVILIWIFFRFPSVLKYGKSCEKKKPFINVYIVENAPSLNRKGTGFWGWYFGYKNFKETQNEHG